MMLILTIFTQMGEWSGEWTGSMKAHPCGAADVVERQLVIMDARGGGGVVVRNHHGDRIRQSSGESMISVSG
jgi:hypothetical protein